MTCVKISSVITDGPLGTENAYHERLGKEGGNNKWIL